jgi:hypothetical protein
LTDGIVTLNRGSSATLNLHQFIQIGQTEPRHGGTNRASAHRDAGPGRSRASPLAQTLLRSEWPWMLYLAFVVLLVVFSFASPWFLSIDNFLNIGRQTTLVSIVAVGMTFVIIAGQIDLSVASTLALSGMAAALAIASRQFLVRRRAGWSRHRRSSADQGTRPARLAIPRSQSPGHAQRRARPCHDGDGQARDHHQRAILDLRRG